MLLNIQQCTGLPPSRHPPTPATYTPIKNYPVPMLVEKKLPSPPMPGDHPLAFSALRRQHQRNNLVCPLQGWDSVLAPRGSIQHERRKILGKLHPSELVRDGTGAHNRPMSDVWQRAEGRIDKRKGLLGRRARRQEANI